MTISQYVELKLKQFYPDLELFYLSATSALDGCLDGDEKRVSESGMDELKACLAELLLYEKNKAKLMHSAKKACQILSDEAMGKVLPNERKLLENLLNDVQKRHNNICSRLNALENDRDTIYSTVKSEVKHKGHKCECMVREHMNDMIKSIPTWLEEFIPETKFGFIPSKKKREQVVEETTNYLKNKLDREQHNWRKNTLELEIEREVHHIFNFAEQELGQIFAIIDDIYHDLDGSNDYNAVPMLFWQRLADDVGDLLIEEIRVAVSGNVNSIEKELAKNIAFKFDARPAHFNRLPVLSLSSMVVLPLPVWSISNFIRTLKMSERELIAEVSEIVVDNMVKETENQAMDLSNHFEKKMNEVLEQITEAVSKEIGDVKVRMDCLIEEKKLSEDNIIFHKNELEDCEKHIHDLIDQVRDYIFELDKA